MAASLLVWTVVAVIGLWVLAIVDMIRATEMESTGRLILAAVLIFVAPIGLLLWMALRGGTVGKVAATAVATVTVGVAIVIFAGISSSSNGGPRTLQVQSSGIDVWVQHGAQSDPTGPRDHPPGHPGVTNAQAGP